MTEDRRALLSESEEAALLKNIAEALNEANDITQAMDAILPQLSRVLGLTTAWAFRFDARQAIFDEVGASGLPPALARNDASPLKSGWCECQDRMSSGRLDTAVNIVRCSRLRDAVGDKWDLKFHASIPLRMNGKALGILNVAASGARVFAGPALDLLRAIGYHVAVTIDRAALLSDMRHHNERLEAFSSIARELTGILDPSALFERALHLVQERWHYDALAVVEGTQILHQVVDARGTPSSAYSYHNQAIPPLPANRGLILPDAGSAMSVPIPGSPYAIHAEALTPHAFNHADQDILSAFAWHLTALWDQARLHQQAVQAARWAERRELAADLHDSVSQHLFSAQLLTRTLRQQTDEKRESLPGLADRLEDVIRAAQSEMRTLIDTLRAETDVISQELLHRVQQFHNLTGTRVTWDIPPLPVRLSVSKTTAILRILDEALQNTLKHAPGAAVRVRLHTARESLVLTVDDDGPGFDTQHRHDGYGLQTMRERAAASGFSWSLHSHLGRGTTVTVGIPCAGQRGGDA